MALLSHDQEELDVQAQPEPRGRLGRGQHPRQPPRACSQQSSLRPVHGAEKIQGW